MSSYSSRTLLAIDTATREASVALTGPDGAVLEASEVVTTHSEQLLAIIEGLFQQAGIRAADLDGVVCGLGPGSFTGLRIGLATAKGLCWALGKPILGVCSLDALARSVAEMESSQTLCLLDARKQQLYRRSYRRGQPLEELRVVEPQRALEGVQDDAVVVGDGLVTYGRLLKAQRPQLRFCENHSVKARYLIDAAAERLTRPVWDEVANLEPLYVRRPELRMPATPQAGHAR